MGSTVVSWLSANRTWLWGAAPLVVALVGPAYTMWHNQRQQARQRLAPALPFIESYRKELQQQQELASRNNYFLADAQKLSKMVQDDCANYARLPDDAQRSITETQDALWGFATVSGNLRQELRDFYDSVATHRSGAQAVMAIDLLLAPNPCQDVEPVLVNFPQDFRGAFLGAALTWDEVYKLRKEAVRPQLVGDYRSAQGAALYGIGATADRLRKLQDA